MKEKAQKRIRRHARIRSTISGTSARPRLCVFKSNAHVIAQIIDDVEGKTLVSVVDRGLKGKTKTERAKEAGTLIARSAQEKKIKEVVFDRGGFIFTGRVKAFAEGAREGGLVF